jgi:predicted nucleotidyltransferase
MTLSRARIDVQQERIAELCRRRHIRWLALFGSVLRRLPPRQ